MLGYYIVKLFSKFMCVSPLWLRKLVAKFLGSVAVAVAYADGRGQHSRMPGG